MLLKIIVNDLLGYVDICVEGYFIERFINICISKKIFLWNVRREKSSILRAHIGIADFKRIKNVAKTTKCNVKIEQKKGLPFLFHKYRKRKIFAVLLLIICLGILAMTNYVWNIEIKTEGDTIVKEELLENLKQSGLTIGKLKNKINTKEIINDIRLKRQDIAWIGIELKGTNAIVEAVPMQAKPEIIPEEEYCNIVSDKEGMIVKISAQNGTALVKPGDIVKQGTILVGGYMEGKYTGTRYVHSHAQIEAKVWYSKKEKINYQQTLKKKTGKEETKYELHINNFRINFYKTLSKFQKYDTIWEDKKLKLFSDFYLPISLKKATNHELQEEQVTYSEEEVKQQGIQKLEQALDKELEEKKVDKEHVLNKQTNFQETSDGIIVEVIYEVLESIGTKEKIVF